MPHTLNIQQAVKLKLRGPTVKRKTYEYPGGNPTQEDKDDQQRQEVSEVYIIHVGGTRCVTSSTGNNMKIRARTTLNVEFIRTCIFIFLLYV